MSCERLICLYSYTSLVDVLRKTYHSNGVRGLYRGYIATALGVMPYVGVLFFSYDTLKKAYSGAVFVF